MTTIVDTMTADELARTEAATPDAGLGALTTDRGNLPLDEIDVTAAITGLHSRIELHQGFRNPYDVPLEATYIFPLPPRAAVTGMRMDADGRTVRAELKERGRARQDYDEAIEQGRRAAIAEEERQGVFTMRVGNILPGERVAIRLTMVAPLSYQDDEAEFRFPLVVAPRYVPGEPLPGGSVGTGTASDTDAAPDASRITPPLLLPGFPDPVRLRIGVDIDPAGLPVESVASSLHVVSRQAGDGGRVRVELAEGDRCDRDFLLRLRCRPGDRPAGSLAVAADPASAAGTGETGGDGDGGTFVLSIVPPEPAGAGDRPRDVVLVLDRSGSMGGWKMVAARRAAARIVDTLTAADRFAVLTFDNRVEAPAGLPDGLVTGTDRHRFRAVEHLAGVDARGGTELLAPLSRAADLLAGDEPAADGRRDRVLVLVTDGQVGNEEQILRALRPRLEHVRVHTVGVDTAVNEAFLERLAGVGGGRAEFVESEDRLDEAMRAVHRRIAAPAVRDLRIEAAGLRIDPVTLAPAVPADLFPGAPVVVSGRFTGPAEGGVTVSGLLPDGSTWRQRVQAVGGGDAALGAVWARARIRDLDDHYATAIHGELSELEHDIIAVSLAHQVLSRFTAFVAIDERVVTEGGRPHRVTQPVHLPQGWQQAAASPVMAGPPPGGGARPMAARFTTARPAAAGRMLAADSVLASRRETFGPGASQPGMPRPGMPQPGMPQPGVPRPPHVPPPPPGPPPVGPPPGVPTPVGPGLGAPGRPGDVPAPVRPEAGAVLGLDVVRLFALDALAELHAQADGEPAARVAALARLRTTAEGVLHALPPGPAADPLRTLVALLTSPPSTAQELTDRWDRVVALLESLAGPPPAEPTRRAFWRR